MGKVSITVKYQYGVFNCKIKHEKVGLVYSDKKINKVGRLNFSEVEFRI